MQNGSLSLGSLVLFALSLGVTACSGSKVEHTFGGDDPAGNGATDKGDGTGTGGGGGGGSFGDTDGGNGGTTVCTPAPGNYEIPNNGCDDDGDGKVDNVAACDTSLAVTGNAADFAKALGICQVANGPNDTKWGVIAATYTKGYQETAAPADGQHGILGKFGGVVKPREGASLGVLSTGWAREYDSSAGSSGKFKGGTSMTGSGTVPPGYPKAASGCSIASDVHDVAAVRLMIKVPTNAQGMQFDFNFHSGEWPEFVCTDYNDGFIAYLKSSAFNGGQAENVSFDAQNNPVSVNNGFFDRCTPQTTTGCSGGGLFGGGNTKVAACPGGDSELGGTGFDAKGTYCGNKQSTGGGATGWLTSQAPVKPGEVITVEFMIWDTGDSSYDSSVLVDNLTWSPTATVTKTDRPK